MDRRLDQMDTRLTAIDFNMKDLLREVRAGFAMMDAKYSESIRKSQGIAGK